MFRLPVLSVLMLTWALPATAVCIGDACIKTPVDPLLNEAGKRAKEIGTGVAEGAKNAAEGATKPLMEMVPDDVQENIGRELGNLEGAIEHLPKDLEEGVQDALTTQEKAWKDTAAAAVKAADDIVDAAEAAARFAESQAKAYPDALTDAEKRFRDGKVVDAFWHMAVDPARDTDDAAARAVQESQIIDAAAQLAVNAYGGPAGSAAYAAWRAYHMSGGSIETAIKAGVVAYVNRSGQAYVNGLPANTFSEVAQKAATAGAMTGVAVAASGGTNEQSIDAAVKSGGAVIVQYGQAYAEKELAEAKGQLQTFEASAKAKADTYCMSISEMTCKEAAEWYEDTRKRAEAIEKMASQKPSVVYTQNGEWAISWVPPDAAADPAVRPAAEAAALPSVALTYIGPGSPFRDEMEKIIQPPAASEGTSGPDIGFIGPNGDSMSLTAAEAGKGSSLGWIYLGRRISDGTWQSSRSRDLAGHSVESLAEQVISLDIGVNLRATPFHACNITHTPIVGGLAAGTEVRILRAIRLPPGCSNYIWAEVAAVP